MELVTILTEFSSGVFKRSLFVINLGVELVDRRDDFVVPFGVYRAIPKTLAKGFRGVDDAVQNVGGDRLSSVTYWMVEK